ncbi:DUF7681 family protein [Endozoicomonas ascidiicola]|uniref:Acb2/Tad1 domain-containing protein n=1 Tax=Endozoicomonas ascidiicola TaxID=1698521 RepID=UPI000835049C|nr:hypothetical protein [Endozoicomonas ascidiicola]
MRDALTEGEWRVGITFNPSNNEQVEEIKQLTADLIDLIANTGKDDRSTALAQSHYENAAMWAVKSITKQPR